jgi:hypothetical protein
MTQKTQLLEQLLKGFAGQQPNEGTERDRDDTQRESDPPFAAANGGYLERCPTYEDDRNLATDF